MSSILVTGGAGFIGSHTCVELIKSGFDVCIVDSLVNSSINTISKIRKILNISDYSNYGKLIFKKGDLRDKNFLEDIFVEFKNNKKPIQGAIHFAGLKSVEESINFPLKYWETNLGSTLSLLEIMNRQGCNNLVFSSSATIYKPTSKERLDENSLINPINSYGNTKFAIEKILEDLFVSNSTKWRIASLRYFNPVGAHSSGIIGESPLIKPTNLFPIIVKVAKGEYEHLSIFGNDWPTNDGTCVRDFIHVMDLADAHIAAYNFLINDKPQIISFNIGTGKGTSVLEAVEVFKDINKCQVPFQFAPRRKGDIGCVVADNNLALKKLNWKPKRDLYQMCSDIWNWINLN